MGCGCKQNKTTYDVVSKDGSTVVATGVKTLSEASALAGPSDAIKPVSAPTR